jgi:hypothetical protein
MTMTQERPAEAVDSFAALSAAVHPAWHQAIIRLANATERVAVRLECWMATPGGDDNFVRAARDLAEVLIDFLDAVDGDPDLEPSLGTGMNGGDDREAEDEHDEPSLGWTDREAMRGRYSGLTDRELDRSDDEPSLGSPVMVGMSELRSQEHWAQGLATDREEDSDFEEDFWPAPAA